MSVLGSDFAIVLLSLNLSSKFECQRLLQKFSSCSFFFLLTRTGTGLVGQALKELGYKNLHAADLSQDMLKQAAAKGVYSSVHETGAEDMPFEVKLLPSSLPSFLFPMWPYSPSLDTHGCYAPRS